MSPAFQDILLWERKYHIVMPSGSLGPWDDVTGSFGVRPVINLKADTLITKGDGSSINPFVLSEN